MGSSVIKQAVICIVILFSATLAGSWAQSGTKYLDGRMETVATPSVDRNNSNNELDSNKNNPSNSHPHFCPTCENCPAGYENGWNSNSSKYSSVDF